MVLLCTESLLRKSKVLIELRTASTSLDTMNLQEIYTNKEHHGKEDLKLEMEIQ